MGVTASHHIPVDGLLLVAEAQIITERIRHNTFKGASGWLEKWKKDITSVK